MSIFPAKILVATDGSREAELASSSAADLAERTGSELHFVYVGHLSPAFYESPGAWALDPDLQRRMQERVEEEVGTRLNEQVQRVREAGGEVAGTHARVGRPDAEIVGLAGELGRPHRSGKPRSRALEERIDGQRLGFGGPPRSLPRPGSARLSARSAQ